MKPLPITDTTIASRYDFRNGLPENSDDVFVVLAFSGGGTLAAAIAERMPIVRLVDGGVTDNLGVRGSMMSPVTQYGDVPNMAGAFSPDNLRRVKQVLVMVANAQTYPEHKWSLNGEDPGFFDTISASSQTALGTLNNETVSLAKKEFLQWGEHVNAQRAPDSPQVKVHFSVLTFDQIKDKNKRAKFDAMPTTFDLQPKQVDALRDL